MTKTIEEAASQAITDNNFFMAVPENPQIVDRGLEQMRACKWVINHIFSLPLPSRLTAEEKERVRAMYSEAQSWLDEKTSFDNPNEQLRLCAVAIQDRLERIFGADFFKEGE